MLMRFLHRLLNVCRPAARQFRLSSVDVLREAAESASSSFSPFHRRRMQAVFIVGETGLAMMLFIAGGLLMRSFVKLSTVAPGYEASHVVTFQVPLPRGGGGAPSPPATILGDSLVARLKSLPSVRIAGYAEALPTVGPVGRQS